MKGKTTDGRFVEFEFGCALDAVELERVESGLFEKVEFCLDEMHEYNMDQGKGDPLAGWTWFWESVMTRVVPGGTIEMRTTAEKL